jgi:hypothetical protein
MRIYLRAKVLVLLFAILTTLVFSQTADDDEVDTSIPGYPFKFYSGNPNPMQGIFSSVCWLSLKLYIMYSFPRRTIFQTIHSSYGSQVHLDAQPYWPASTRTAPSSSIQERLPSP